MSAPCVRAQTRSTQQAAAPVSEQGQRVCVWVGGGVGGEWAWVRVRACVCVLDICFAVPTDSPERSLARRPTPETYRDGLGGRNNWGALAAILACRCRPRLYRHGRAHILIVTLALLWVLNVRLFALRGPLHV